MVRPPDASHLCLKCKGSRGLCGRPRCSILARISALMPVASQIQGTDLFGASPPSVFVGRYGYPDVLAGPLVPPEHGDTSLLADPERWYGKSVEEIISFRSRLVRPSFRTAVRSARFPGKFLDATQEIAMAETPTEVEARLSKVPRAKVVLTDYFQPMGPTAPVRSLHVTENPRVGRAVESLVGDTDAKANTAMTELYERGTSIPVLSRLLSAGLLGISSNRKLVPTRWSITASDDIVGKRILSEVKDYQTIDKYEVYSASHLDNHYRALLMPSTWMFESMEAWYPGTVWMSRGHTVKVITDHEFYGGRKTYADNVTGAYYSARLAVIEHLQVRKRQAGAIVFREVRDGYYAPLGVWQIREGVREAMRGEPQVFETLEEGLFAALKGFGVPITKWKKESKIIDTIAHQRTLDSFFQ